MSVTLATVRRRRGKSWSSDEARKFFESARGDEDSLYAAYALVLVILADLNVHPRVTMQVLRHARFSVTMEIYTQVTLRKIGEALKRLGDSLSRRRELLYIAAVPKQKGHLPHPESGL